MTKPTSHSWRKSGLASIVQRVAGRAAGNIVPVETVGAGPRRPRNHWARLISRAERADGVMQLPESPELQAAVVGLLRVGIVYIRAVYRAATRECRFFGRVAQAEAGAYRPGVHIEQSRERRRRWISDSREKRRSSPEARAVSAVRSRCCLPPR